MFKNNFKKTLIAASLSLVIGSVASAETAPAINDGGRVEYAALQEKLSKIEADREGVINGVVETWRNEPSISLNVAHWEEEIATELNKASTEDLLKIQNAGSYNEVRVILRGDQQSSSVSSAANNAIGPEALGDTFEDLVYTPIFPCRIFDTRVVGGGYAGGLDIIKSMVLRLL